MRILYSLIALIVLSQPGAVLLAAVPHATVYGPIEADPPGHPSRNSIYSASAIELDAHGYLEEEYFIEGIAPPRAEPLRVRRMMPTLEFARDGHGNVLGGIRLAAHAVPTAKNTGMNSGTGNRFCFLYGSHEPFSEAELQRLYPSHADYVSSVRKVVGRNLEAGFILPEAAVRTVREAQQSRIGRRDR